MKTKWLNRVLAIAVVLCLVIGMVPATALADGQDDPTPQTESDSGDLITTEDALQAAVANGGTVTLGDDITLAATLTIAESTTVILNLNGHTLTGTSEDTITNNGTLTIQGTGTVTNTVNGKTALLNNGTAALNGGTFIRNDVSGNSYYTVVNHGTMTVDGATISNTGSYASCVENGWNDLDDVSGVAELTVKSGTITGGLNAVKNDNSSVLYVEGGTIQNSVQYAVMNYGTATISGGEIRCTVPDADVSTSKSGSAIYNHNSVDDPGSTAQLNITGGTVTCNNHGVYNYSGNVIISGAAEVTGGVYAVYSSGSVEISGNAELSGGSSGISLTGSDAVLEISGGTITGKKYYGITLGESSSAVISGGTLISERTGSNAYVVRLTNASVEITGGTLGSSDSSNKATVYLTGGSTADISGGEFLGAENNIYVSSSGTNTATVTGGTFSTDVSSYLAEGCTQDENGTVSGGTKTYVAQVGTEQYETLAEAISAAQAGDTVTLLADILLDPTAVADTTSEYVEPLITINKDLTLNLSGHSIKLDQTKLPDDMPYTPAIFEIQSSVTITGDGLIDAEAGYNNSYGINVNGGSLTIESGTFTGAPTAVQVQTGSLTINGGSFDLADTIKSVLPAYAMYIINAIDENWDKRTAQISIAGGTFGYDYSSYPSESAGTYLADGYEMVQNSDGTYGVQEDTNVYVAEVSGTKYTTLTEAVAAVQDDGTITLLADVTNEDYDNVIDIILPAGATLDGDGHTLEGNIKVTVNAAGGTIQNVNFKNIHNNANSLSAVYGSSLSGTLTVTGCTFHNCDWDALQITPVANANITITGNTFSTDNTDGTNQVRYVHIQSKTNVDFSATVTKNVMYDTIKGVNGAGLKCGALEIYYFTNPEKITTNMNYIEYPELNCILMNSGTNVGEMVYPMYATDDLNEDNLITPVAAIKTTYEGTYYTTLQEAINAAGNSDTVTLLADVTESVTIPDGKVVTLNLNGKTLTNEAGKDTITVALDAELTVTGNGTVDNVSHQMAAVVNNGTTTLNGGSYTRSQEASTSTEDANGNSYYNILNHGVMTINEGVSVTSTGAFSSLIDNGYYSYSSTNPRLGYVEGVNQAEPSLTINSGTFSGGINTIKNDDAATVKITGGSFSNVTQHVVLNWNIASIEGGTFDSSNGASVTIQNNGDSNNINQGKLTITGGTFTSSEGTSNLGGSGGTIAVSGGTFSSEVPEDYCAGGFEPKANEDGTFGVQEIKPAILTYTDDNGNTVTESYDDPATALTEGQGKTDAVVTVVADVTTTSALYAYRAKLVINKGVTLTCKAIAVSTSGISGVTVENNGTIESTSMIYGNSGNGTLVNNGTIRCTSLFSASTEGWVNDGSIAAGGNVTLKSFENNGTITGAEGKTMTVSGTSAGTNAYLVGTYDWDAETAEWVANGKVYVIRDGKTVAMYNSLMDAYNYAESGDTLQLQADLSTSCVMAVENKSLTLDLHGYSITFGNSVSNSGILTVANGGALTVTDSSATEKPTVDGDGNVTYTAGMIKATFGLPAIYVKAGGTFTLDSGIIESGASAESGGIPAIYIGSADIGRNASDVDATGAVVNIMGGWVYAADQAGVVICGTDTANNPQSTDPTLNVSGGVISSMSSGAIMGQGAYHNTIINISGGSIISSEAPAIYHPQYGVMTITGGTITGANGITVKGGTVTISGENTVITGTGEASTPDAGGSSGSYITGNAVYIEDNYGYGPTVTITGGTFIAQDDNAEAVNILFAEGENQGSFVISGGTYSTEPDAALLATGYVANLVEDESGNYIVKLGGEAFNTETRKYGTLADMLSNAATGQTVQLLQNVTVDNINVGAGVTLDLNGQTLKVNSAASFGQVKDSSNGTGVLVTDNLTLTSSNEQLPIFISEDNGYRFVNFKFQSFAAQSGTDESVEFWCRVLLDDANTYNYLKSNNAHGLKVSMHVSVDGCEDTWDFVYTDSMLGGYAESIINSGKPSKYVLYLKLTGLQSFSGATVKGLPKLESTSAIGFEVTAKEITYTVPGGVEEGQD